jgi:hypothetical protein
LKDLDPCDIKKGLRFKLEWNAGETLDGPLPMIMTWGLQRTCQVESTIVIEKKKKKDLN